MSRLFILFSVCLLVSCSGVYKQVSPSIKSKTVESLSKVTPERKKELEASIKNLPASQREGMAFLFHAGTWFANRPCHEKGVPA